MHTFFHGWRRKTGCVTLVMACMISAVWGRGHFVFDHFMMTTGNYQHTATFVGGSVYLWLWSKPHYAGLYWWQTIEIDSRETLDSELLSNELAMQNHIEDHDGTTLAVRLWMGVAPLTILSAYLILWKPGKRSTSD